LAYTLTAALPASGVLLFVKLAGAGLLAVGAFVALGEFGAGELRAVRSMLGRTAKRKITAAADGAT
jgi:hypothetical protein